MNENFKIEISICILCVCILLPILILGMYNRPSADDYDYSIQTHNIIVNGGNIFEVIKTAWQTDINFYNSWQGLYTSAFILALQPAIWGESLYCLTTIIIITIVYLCLLASVYIINKHFIKRSFVFTIMFSFIILTTLTLMLPSPTEGLYWYNGAMNYIPWQFTNILGICLLIEIYFIKEKYKNKKYLVLIICSGLLSFLTSGANHVTAFSNIIVMLIISIYLIFWKKRYYSLIPLVSAIIGFTIMYLAPGTAIRQSYFIRQSVIDTIIMAIKHTKLLLSKWINLNWVLSLILITPISLEIAIKSKFMNKFPFWSILFSMMIICGMLCVPFYAMGSFGEGRLTNVIWISFMFCSWIIYTKILGFIIHKKYIDISKFINSKKYQVVSRMYICYMSVMLIY